MEGWQENEVASHDAEMRSIGGWQDATGGSHVSQGDVLAIDTCKGWGVAKKYDWKSVLERCKYYRTVKIGQAYNGACNFIFYSFVQGDYTRQITTMIDGGVRVSEISTPPHDHA